MEVLNNIRDPAFPERNKAIDAFIELVAAANFACELGRITEGLRLAVKNAKGDW
jgi:hypothetical protein